MSDILICMPRCVGSSSVHVRPSQGITTPAHVLLGGCISPGGISHFDGGQDRQLIERTGLRIVRHYPPEWPVTLDRIAVLAAVGQVSTYWTGTPLDRRRTSHLARLELGLAA
jgi:hypothetical protein